MHVKIHSYNYVNYMAHFCNIFVNFSKRLGEKKKEKNSNCYHVQKQSS